MESTNNASAASPARLIMYRAYDSTASEIVPGFGCEECYGVLNVFDEITSLETRSREVIKVYRWVRFVNPSSHTLLPRFHEEIRSLVA